MYQSGIKRCPIHGISMGFRFTTIAGDVEKKYQAIEYFCRVCRLKDKFNKGSATPVAPLKK